MTAGKITGIVFGVLVTLLYAYMVVAAVGNLTGITAMSGVLGLTLTGTGWFWLILGIALPPIGFAIALLLGRGRSLGLRVLVLAAGLASVAAIQLEILHLVPQSSFFG